MTSQTVTYEGPADFAVRAAALLADAEGVELTSATRAATADDTVALVVTLEGTEEAIGAAVDGARAELPAGATFT